MSSPEEADHWFHHYGLTDIARVSNPDKSLYRAFGLGEAALGELAHPRVWWPWLRTALFSGHGVGVGGPNWRQLTGVFVVHRSQVLAAIRHRNSAARPDYVALLQGVIRIRK
jgi:hypothetical protein